MASLLLAVIYAAFISLGLPDSLLGSAWPVLRAELGAPLSYAGMVSMIIAGGTIVSSLLSDRLTRRFGAGLVTAVSVALTAAALAGFSLAPSFAVLCLWAVPYGLGAGAVDAALNNYVALHFAARHMSWLHCFWGIGASVSPYIMGFCLSGAAGWRGGYRAVSLLQLGLTIVLFAALPLWRGKGGAPEEDAPARAVGLAEALKIRGVPYVLLAFLSYCALESTTGLWASSYLVGWRGVDAETAARFGALFYLGITGGRFLNGFLAERAGDRRLIRGGALVMLLGILLVGLPLPPAAALAGLVVIGLGCAPVYPSIIHATPDNFGRENSQAIVGIQMASAYTGTTFLPPLFGLLAERTGVGLYPAFLAVFALLLLAMTERLNRAVG